MARDAHTLDSLPFSFGENLTLQFRKVVYQIQTKRPTYALRKAQVTVCLNAKNEVTILYKDQQLNYTIFNKQAKQSEIVTSKDIDRKLDRLRQAHKPAPEHSWRTYGQRLNKNIWAERLAALPTLRPRKQDITTLSK